jgi:hypothetical protein
MVLSVAVPVLSASLGWLLIGLLAGNKYI